MGFNTETTEGTVIVGGMGEGIMPGSVFKKVKMFVGTPTEHSDERGGNAGGG